MWISRDRYNNLIDIEQHCEERVERRSVLLNEAMNRIKILYEQCNMYRSDAEKYKQMYADEVQKRLELVKLLGNNS